MTYRDSSNQAVLSCVVREVKALNPVFLTQHIKGLYVAVFTYFVSDVNYSLAHETPLFCRFCISVYRSRCEESVKRRGMLKGKNKSKRKHERTVRVSSIPRTYMYIVRGYS